jgi:uncharacterized protein (DUF2062 family)
LVNLWRTVRERLIQPMARAQGSPTSIARGTAIGTWVALTPTVGIQMFLVTVLAIPLRANLPIPLALVWVSNPFTVIPMYYSYYWLGTFVLGIETRGYRGLAASFSEQIAAIADQGLLTSLGILGAEVLWPLAVGSVILATAMAIPAYQVGLRLAARRRARMLREQARELDVQDPMGTAPASRQAPAPAPERRGGPTMSGDAPVDPPQANISETSRS